MALALGDLLEKVRSGCTPVLVDVGDAERQLHDENSVI